MMMQMGGGMMEGMMGKGWIWWLVVLLAIFIFNQLKR